MDDRSRGINPIRSGRVHDRRDRRGEDDRGDDKSTGPRRRDRGKRPSDRTEPGRIHYHQWQLVGHSQIDVQEILTQRREKSSCSFHDRECAGSLPAIEAEDEQGLIDGATLGRSRLRRCQRGREGLRADISHRPRAARRLPESFSIPGDARQATTGHGLIGPDPHTGSSTLPQDGCRDRRFTDIGIGTRHEQTTALLARRLIAGGVLHQLGPLEPVPCWP